MKISVYNRPLNQLVDESYCEEKPQKQRTKVSVFALDLGKEDAASQIQDNYYHKEKAERKRRKVSMFSFEREKESAVAVSKSLKKMELRPKIEVEGNSSKIKLKKNVKFGDVEVYRFGLKQGIDTVPSMGGVSLGMEERHHQKHRFCLEEYNIYKDVENRVKQASWQSVSHLFHTLERMRRKRKRRELGGKIKNKRKRRKLMDKALESSKSTTSESEVEPEDEKLPQLFEQYRVDDPLRRVILANAGVLVNEDIVNQSMELAKERSQCGCRCKNGKCRPNKCKCALDGVKCQVDFKDDSDLSSNFPCSCTSTSCKNPEGRIELDTRRIRNHFLQTLMRIKAAEKIGLNGNGESSSPKHTIFHDEQQYKYNLLDENVKSTKQTNKKIRRDNN